jgi:hypothetical protein
LEVEGIPVSSHIDEGRHVNVYIDIRAKLIHCPKTVGLYGKRLEFRYVCSSWSFRKKVTQNDPSSRERTIGGRLGIDGPLTLLY